MTVECLLDTNILIYAASTKTAEMPKKKRANELILNKRFGLSTQVLAEFYAVTTAKMKPPLSPQTAKEWIEELKKQPLVPVDAEIVEAGIEISRRFRISYWDAAILAAAEALGAPLVYSEDLGDGQVYGAVKVINPFRDIKPASGFHDQSQATL